MLSARTIAEMKAGAETLAAHAGKNGIDPEYMEAMIRTQQRASWLKALEKDGKIRIERMISPQHLNTDRHIPATTVVHIGTETFDDVNAELTGSWPSEVLVARIAMALSSGQADGTRDGT